jgi:CRISPR-associated protein Csb2
MWVVAPGEEPEPNLAAGTESRKYRLRVATAGTLRYLQHTFNGEAIAAYDALQEATGHAKGKEKARLRQEMQLKFGNERPTSRRPQLTNWESYGDADAAEPGAEWPSPFDSQFLILEKLEGPVLGQEQTLELAAGLRNAAMAAKGSGIPEWLSGHTEDGGPSRKNHAAFFALPYVGGPYGDGHVLGVAMALPRDVEPSELREILGPLLFDPDTGEERPVRIWNPEQTWQWDLGRETRPSPPTALRRETWTAASTRWATVTPVVLHHYPKRNRDGDIERILTEALVNSGYPAPVGLEFGPIPQWRGAEPAQDMPSYGEGDPKGCRYHTHVSVTFPVPVTGPVLVGRGRYRGYGLFRPVRGQG